MINAQENTHIHSVSKHHTVNSTTTTSNTIFNKTVPQSDRSIACPPSVAVRSKRSCDEKTKKGDQKSGSEGDSSENVTLSNFLAVGKVALALAIIKSRPHGQTGQQYTETLCGHYLSGQLHYTRQNQRLRDEVLLLRQKLHGQSLADLTSGQAGVPAEAGGDRALTPPSSLDDRSNKASADVYVANNYKFLQSVIAVKKAGQYNADTLCDSTVSDSLVAALRQIQQWITQPGHGGISHGSVKHVIDAVLDLFTLSHKGTDCIARKNTGLHEEILSIIKTLIVNTMNFDPLENFSHQEELCNILLRLCSCPGIQMAAVRLLLKCIHDYSRHLKQVARQQVAFNPLHHENICHIFLTLQGTLKSIDQQNQKNSDTCLKFDTDLLREQLEDSLIFISEDFPLFAMFIWKIGGIISGMSQTQNFTDKIRKH